MTPKTAASVFGRWLNRLAFNSFGQGNAVMNVVRINESVTKDV